MPARTDAGVLRRQSPGPAQGRPTEPQGSEDCLDEQKDQRKASRHRPTPSRRAVLEEGAGPLVPKPGEGRRVTAPAPIEDDIDEEPAPKRRAPHIPGEGAYRPPCDPSWTAQEGWVPGGREGFGTLYCAGEGRITEVRPADYVGPDPACPTCQGSGWGVRERVERPGRPTFYRQRGCPCVAAWQARVA